MRFRSGRRPEPERQAPSWRRTAREASSPRSVRNALARLGATPAELIGPEPPAVPPVGGRFGWLAPYRTLILWMAAAVAFGLTVQLLVGSSRLGPALIPVVAVLMLVGWADPK